MTMVRRAFCDFPDGHLHYRRAGAGVPLLLFHASPGSSRQTEPLIVELAADHAVLAPDTPGNGDSTPLTLPGGRPPTIADYAARALAWLDTLALRQIRVYGSHTGAAIACELAALAPDRVTSVVLDGAIEFEAEERDRFLRDYAPAFAPTLDGDHLIRAFQFCRDQHLFYPWFRRDAAHARTTGLPDAARLHDTVLDVLKAATTYPHSYHAAFRYPFAERLATVRCPVLALAGAGDPLRETTRALLAQAPRGRLAAVAPYGQAGHWPAVAALIRTFHAEEPAA